MPQYNKLDPLATRLLAEWRCDWLDDAGRQDEHGDYDSSKFNAAASEIYQHVFAGDTVFMQPQDSATAYVVRRPASWRLLRQVCQGLSTDIDRRNCRFYGTVPLSFRYIPGCGMLKIVSTENLERLGRWRKAQRMLDYHRENLTVTARFDLGPGVYQLCQK